MDIFLLMNNVWNTINLRLISPPLMSILQLNVAQFVVVVVEDLHIFRILAKVIPPIHPITETTKNSGHDAIDCYHRFDQAFHRDSTPNY
jgi:hypothetical protein